MVYLSDNPEADADFSWRLKMEKELSVDKPYIRHDGKIIAYRGGANFKKDSRQCPSGCEGTLHKCPTNVTFLEWEGDYLIVHVTDRGIMFVDNTPPDFYWRCNTCTQGFRQVNEVKDERKSETN